VDVAAEEAGAGESADAGDAEGAGDGPGDPQAATSTAAIETATRVRRERALRPKGVGRGMAGIVARAQEVAVSSSSAVLGIHRGGLIFDSRNCGTKPSERQVLPPSLRPGAPIGQALPVLLFREVRGTAFRRTPGLGVIHAGRTSR
jgi:hypothetical protein